MCVRENVTITVCEYLSACACACLCTSIVCLYCKRARHLRTDSYTLTHTVHSKSKHTVRSKSKHTVRSKSKHTVRSSSKHTVRSKSKHTVRSNSKHTVRSKSKHKVRSTVAVSTHTSTNAVPAWAQLRIYACDSDTSSCWHRPHLR